MAGIWDSCPMKEKPTSNCYDLRRPFESATYKLDLKMWGWLEKAKAEWKDLEIDYTLALDTAKKNLELAMNYKEKAEKDG